jgi:hypothetical protein
VGNVIAVTDPSAPNDTVNLRRPPLASLSSLSTLKVVVLDGADVTDYGIDIVAQLPSIQAVSVRRTSVTMAAVDALKKRRGIQVMADETAVCSSIAC